MVGTEDGLTGFSYVYDTYWLADDGEAAFVATNGAGVRGTCGTKGRQAPRALVDATTTDNTAGGTLLVSTASTDGGGGGGCFLHTLLGGN